ncbi:MAG TPA: type II secretion system F family protein [Candidatus Eisenbacteria bacterium]|jgi:tight adherence protein B
MIYVVFAVLMFGATVALVLALKLRRREQGMQALRERVGVPRSGLRAVPRLPVERDDRLSAVPPLDRLLRGLSAARRIELLLYQAGMQMRVGTFLLLTAVCGLGSYLLGVTVSRHSLHGIVAGVLGACVPSLIVRWKKSVRMRAFAEEFPDALDLLVSALRAGISFSSALQIVADESPEPVRSEFAIVVEEQTLGLDLREALMNLAGRVDSLDLKFFVTAVVLHRDTGGNLTEVLENTSGLIRDRFRILGDIRTFTAQGRLTGAILSLLPLGVAVFMLLVAPDYFHKMWDLPAGRAVLAFAALMQVLGALVIRKIVRIRV